MRRQKRSRHLQHLVWLLLASSTPAVAARLVCPQWDKCMENRQPGQKCPHTISDQSWVLEVIVVFDGEEKEVSVEVGLVLSKSTNGPFVASEEENAINKLPNELKEGEDPAKRWKGTIRVPRKRLCDECDYSLAWREVPGDNRGATKATKKVQRDPGIFFVRVPNGGDAINNRSARGGRP